MALVLAAVLAAAQLGACQRARAPVEDPTPATAVLALLPEDVAIVLGVDLDRLRAQPVWKTLSPLLAKLAGPQLDAIAAGTGIEPARQIHHLWVGLPGERQDDGRLIVVADTDPLDVARFSAWLARPGHGAFTLRLPSERRIVMAKGAWATPATSPAAANPELRRLCQRAAGGHGLWFAALVPAPLRQTWLARGPFTDVAAMARVLGFLDDGAGLHAELVGEFANSADPAAVAHRLDVLHHQGKRNPDMLIAGLAPYLDALRVEARDARVRVTLDVPDGQTADLVERIEALALRPGTKYSRDREQP